MKVPDVTGYMLLYMVTENEELLYDTFLQVVEKETVSAARGIRQNLFMSNCGGSSSHKLHVNTKPSTLSFYTITGGAKTFRHV